ncbi:MAG: DNA translocase FtsK 4TM domain-containing protein [Acidobacteriota bacterium]|nr:DNA translocase FtsK 4TM domain-containing protein [Acidobacteriota bacterium]
MSESMLSRRFSELAGVVLFGATLIWLVALASYSPADPVWFFNAGADSAPANFAGRIGAFAAEASFQLLGYAAYIMPAILAVVGWHYFWCRDLDAEYTKMIGAVMFVASVAALLSLAFGSLAIEGKTFQAGGYAGQIVAGALAEYLNRTGSAILVLTILVLSTVLTTQFSIGKAFSVAGGAAKGQATGIAARVQAWREERRKEKQRAEVIRKHTEKAGAENAADVARANTMAASLKAARKPEPARKAAVAAAADAEGGEDDEDEIPAAERAKTAARPPAIKRAVPAEQSLPLPEPEPRTPAEKRKGAYTLPPLSLLDPARTERKIDERELMDAARLLEEKCREFSVEGSVVQIHPGPVVTTYEFKPDAGVKYSKITGLMDDLCLAMKAESVLIDRIAGKSTVGIQIPNASREAISLRELLESDLFRRSASRLTIALGKTIHGEGFVSDLAAMPHLLIAGSTGAGKSVSVNAMISSILFRATPEEVRFIMVDPKRLELGMYEGIPHLLTPVVVDPKLAANALRWAVREMEERYKTLAASGVRNIEQYNRNIKAMLAESKTGQDENGKELVTLPFIVVIIDELADLMMVAGNEVEESICRLAQMARAVGIHLILATQRPSVDVITGLIKANLPARISFRVSSRIDSRTILDSGGAEQLLGKGDMLYLPPASSRFVRVHGPYISEQESARLASFLRKQGKPMYDPTITADDAKTAKEGGTEFDKDDLYDEASRIIVSSGQASISYLQRRLRIGFSRAARLVDMMEMDGLVSSANSSSGGKREVLVKKDFFEEVDAQVR